MEHRKLTSLEKDIASEIYDIMLRMNEKYPEYSLGLEIIHKSDVFTNDKVDFLISYEFEEPYEGENR
jgi:hypothetical protein